MDTVQDRAANIIPIPSSKWQLQSPEYPAGDWLANTGEIPYSDRYSIGRE